MELVKPQRRTNIFDYWNVNKRMKITEESNTIKKSNTRLEDLSNELFYEIFNYLDIYHVYKGFYSLNLRLQSLLTNSTVPLKINISSMSKSTFQNYNRQILMPNKHRIRSLRLSNPFLIDYIFSPVRITSNFIRLEILIFDHIKSKYLPNILHHLASLPNLLSLIIIPIDRISSPNDLYFHIFRLPVLKYCKISLDARFGHYTLPRATQTISPIEHLVIDNEFSLDQLDAVLSYVPHLRRLFIQSLNRSYNLQTELFSNRSNNLTHVYFDKITIPFERLEIMSRNLFNQLEVLRISISNDREYLNANRWEQLILLTMPRLRIFDFQYRNFIDGDIDNYNSIIDQFSSPFWTQRRWFFSCQYFASEYRSHVIFYSINPYRRKQYTLYRQLPSKICPRHQARNMNSVDHVYIQNEETMTNCSHYFRNATKLTLADSFTASRVWLAVILKHMIPLKQLTTISIDNTNFSFEQLIKLLNSTPNIHTLTFNCQSIDQINSKSFQQNETFRLLSETNKIINVNIRERFTIENIKLFIALCPRMQHLIIDVHAHELESSIRFILSKTKTNVRNLCLLCVKNRSKTMAGTLKTLIESEELLDNYLIKLIDNDLYLWW